MPRVSAKAKAMAKAEIEQARVVAEEPAVQGTANIDLNNASIMKEVQDAMEKISLRWDGIKDAEPIGRRGSAYKAEELLNSMRDRVTYDCRINLMWVDACFRAQMGVPIRKAAIKLIQDSMDNESFVPPLVEIAVQEEQYDAMAHKGALKRISPPENMFAVILKVAKLMDTKSDAELTQWKDLILDYPARFLLCRGTEMWWHEHNARELVEMQANALSQSDFQRLCGVLHVARELGGGTQCSFDRLVQEYKLRACNVPDNYGDENRRAFNDKPSYIKACLDLMPFTSDPYVMGCLQELDDNFGIKSPLNSVGKLNWIRKACTGMKTEKVHWVIHALVHNITAMQEPLMHISVRDLRPGVNRCIAHCYLLKYDLKEIFKAKAKQLWGEPEESTITQYIHDKMESHEAMHRSENNIKLPNSAAMFMELASSTIFMHESSTNSALHAAARWKRSAGNPAVLCSP